MTPHLTFIVAAYSITVAVVAALVAWVTLDYRLQQRRIAELEMHGFTRRSAGDRPGEAASTVKERA